MTPRKSTRKPTPKQEAGVLLRFDGAAYVAELGHLSPGYWQVDDAELAESLIAAGVCVRVDSVPQSAAAPEPTPSEIHMPPWRSSSSNNALGGVSAHNPERGPVLKNSGLVKPTRSEGHE